jgi:hypothetical protein
MIGAMSALDDHPDTPHHRGLAPIAEHKERIMLKETRRMDDGCGPFFWTMLIILVILALLLALGMGAAVIPLWIHR